MEEKDIWYYIGYWFTALLPVIIGFVFTIVFVIVAQKKYKGEDDEE